MVSATRLSGDLHSAVQCRIRRSGSRRAGFRGLLRRLPWLRWNGRREGGFRSRSGISRSRQRPTPPDDGDCGARRPRNPGLAERRSRSRDDSAGDIRHSCLALKAPREPRRLHKGGSKSAMTLSRRNLLIKSGTGLNGVAAVLMGVPLLGYVLSSFTRSSPQKWISLGPLESFQAGETRLAVYRNPESKPWDGDT